MPQNLIQAIHEASAMRPAGMLVTPLTLSTALSESLGCNVYLKCEHLQSTGSFKYRGAANKMRLLNEAQRASGVVTASSGNHGQALALAGRVAGVRVTVYVANIASPAKMAAIKAYGAELIVLDIDPMHVELFARAEAERSGRTFVSPYNDRDVIAGQGTMGVELLEQLPDVDAVFVAVGGGGLASGLGTALKASRPDIQLIGCWPEVAQSLKRNLEDGRIFDVAEGATISDGTAGNVEPGSITFDMCARILDARVAVSESDIRRAMRDVAEAEHWIVEGAAGVALAGARAMAEQFAGKNVAVILCGRNIGFGKFMDSVNAIAH
jgi:threonine dehydratase